MSAAPAHLSVPLNPEIESELARRCETSLATFIRECWTKAPLDPEKYKHGRHIDIMAEYLEAFIRGEFPRLLINIPPGHMKSLSASVCLNAWVWGPKNMPGKRFMNTSYRADLALRDADKTRELIRSHWYQKKWGHRYQLRKGQDTKSRYANDRGGYRFSCATAGIMGEGGDYVIFDDPHNMQQAESDEVRDETVRLIRMALPTRVRSADGGVLVIMQRLHERDYAGRMIADEVGLEHLCLPARYEYDHPFVTLPKCIIKSKTELPGDFRKNDGELLWSELFNAERMKAITIELTAYGEAGQLQQRPSPREGGMFQRKDFKIIDAKFDGPRKTVRGWDFGATEGGGSYTSGVKISEYADGKILIEHVLRGQWSSHKVDINLKATAKQDGKRVMQDLPQDPGQAGKAQKAHHATVLKGFRVRSSPESGSKETRAGPLSSQSEAGNVYLLRGDWNDPFIDEMCTFPNGAYTDQADGASRAYARLLGRRGQSIGAAPEVIEG